MRVPQGEAYVPGGVILKDPIATSAQKATLLGQTPPPEMVPNLCNSSLTC